MIKLLYDPVKTVIQAAQNLYPALEAEIQFVPELETPGEAIFPDGSNDSYKVPLINVNATIPLTACIEVIAHELAHVAAGYEAEHGPEWEKAFDDINKEYARLVEVEMEATT